MSARPADVGFTFVELLIASMLSVGVLVLAGWMLLASLYGGRDVTESTTKSSQAQILANSVRDGIGSAKDVALTTFATTGQLLKASVVDFDSAGAVSGAWGCTYWAVTGDGRAYTKHASSAVATPTAQTSAAFAGWTLLATGLERLSGQPILSLTGTTVGITARSDAEGGAAAYVDTTIAKRPLPVATGGIAC